MQHSLRSIDLLRSLFRYIAAINFDVETAKMLIGRFRRSTFCPADKPECGRCSSFHPTLPDFNLRRQDRARIFPAKASACFSLGLQRELSRNCTITCQPWGFAVRVWCFTGRYAPIVPHAFPPGSAWTPFRRRKVNERPSDATAILSGQFACQELTARYSRFSRDTYPQDTAMAAWTT